MSCNVQLGTGDSKAAEVPSMIEDISTPGGGTGKRELVPLGDTVKTEGDLLVGETGVEKGRDDEIATVEGTSVVEEVVGNKGMSVIEVMDKREDVSVEGDKDRALEDTESIKEDSVVGVCDNTAVVAFDVPDKTEAFSAVENSDKTEGDVDRIEVVVVEVTDGTAEA